MATDAAERLHDEGNDGIAFTEGISVVARGMLNVPAPSEGVEGWVTRGAGGLGAKDAFECACFRVTKGKRVAVRGGGFGEG